MEKSRQEWVSAAVDGEADAKMLAELASDTASHEQWHNYHLIGDAMRNELPHAIPLELTANIAAALEKEPTILAPVSRVTENQATKKTGNVTPLFRQLGQYAIAASVALVAIVGVQSYEQQSDSSATPASPSLVTRPLVGSASPVSLQTAPSQQYRQAQEYNNEQQLIEQRRRINSYIKDHMLQQRLNAGTYGEPVAVAN